MGNKYLLAFYVSMISEDFDQEFNMFKYLGILENPEGFKELERHINPEEKIEQFRKAQEFESGQEADKYIKSLTWFKKNKDDDGIELG